MSDAGTKDDEARACPLGCAALPRVDDETLYERRTATLQGGHSDLRAVCCGEQGYDIDCENGDPRLIESLAGRTALSHLVPTWIDYVENRTVYIKEICKRSALEPAVSRAASRSRQE